jgi:hypothetical protein
MCKWPMEKKEVMVPLMVSNFFPFSIPKLALHIFGVFMCRYNSFNLFLLQL